MESEGVLKDWKVFQKVDASRLLVIPGLVDIHVHFRDPGFPEKETIRTGSFAAAAGGFTSVICMPNTNPAIDRVETLKYVLEKAAREGEAIINGLADGTLDVIATDHAPHTLEEKSRTLVQAPCGMVGLETCVGLTFTNLVHSGRLSLTEAIAKMTINLLRIMGISAGKLEEGGDADITVIDPVKEWIVNPQTFRSRSRNTPFGSMKLKGKAVLTLVNGKVVYNEMNEAINP